MYWYNYYKQAFGFAPRSDISLTDPYGGSTQDHTSGLNVIRKFVKKVSDNLTRRKLRYIYEIFDEIQDNIH